MPRRNTFHYLFVLIILATASLACRAADIYSDMTVDLMESLFPDLMYGSTTEQDAAINPDSDSPQDVSVQPDVAPPKDPENTQNLERWDINQCNAMGEVTISLSELEEYQDEDGATECHYGYEITQLDDVRIIYHTYIFGNNDNGNEEGWITKGFAPNLGSYTLRSSIYNCPECISVRYERVVLTIAVVYDRPECDWITDGGINFDVLQITEEKPLMSPCSQLYPEHIPDITEGLISD